MMKKNNTVNEGPLKSLKKGLGKVFNPIAKGFQAGQAGGALGPDSAERFVKNIFTPKDYDDEKPAKNTDVNKKNIKAPASAPATKITNFANIPNMLSFKDAKSGVVYTYDNQQRSWTSRDGKTTLDAKQGAIAYNRAKEKSKLESKDSIMKKSVKEGLADLAQRAEHDHEVQMARADLYKIAKYAIKLHEMLKDIPEEQGLEGWQQAKITKASDYVSSVYHNLDYEMKFGEQAQAAELPVLPKTESNDPYKQRLAAKLDEKAKSKAQQRFMGMVYAAKKGEKPASAEVAKVAKGMSKSDAKDFAKTKHKGKPEHVKKKD